MYISRVEVEGGFLDGLDLSLAPGFNAVIGPRGSGKTSLIELIRYALSIPVLTTRASAAIREHAEAVLGDGTVTVTVTDDVRTTTFSRSASANSSRTNAVPDSIIILAQNEVESIATDADGRLRLVDGFVASGAPNTGEPSLLRSIESEYTSLRQELLSLDEQLANVAPVVEDLLVKRKEQKLLAEQQRGLTTEEHSLAALNGKTQELARALEHVRRFSQDVGEWHARTVDAMSATPSTSVLSESLHFSEIHGSFLLLEEASKALRQAIASIIQIQQAAANNAKRLESENTAIEAAARPLRAKLEQIQKGAGDLARQISLLEKRVAEGEAIAEIRVQREERMQALKKRRSALLDEMDAAAVRKSLSREKAAAALSVHLRPAVRVRIAQRSNLDEYRATIARALRGTGMHAGVLSQQIAESISPRQLVEVVEAGDRATLSSIVRISADRAQRLIHSLSATATAALLATRVEDDAEISLLVGPDYKNITKLSTGQRCTAIVPILLSRQNGTLVIDQPEDHLDNAFVVDTLVAAIKNRSKHLQIIFSTHNANLPVLGDADYVIEMASDGVHGYCETAATLTDANIVSAITSVMEGGREAFARRATFYGIPER